MCNACASLDATKAEAFAYQMLNLLNNGALSILISIGHRTGLYDTLSNLPPSTSQEIADKANLNERYVREWLAAMTVGKIVEYDPETKQYSLPPEHASYLTRAAVPENLAVVAQYIGLMGCVEDKILDCFKNGGGLQYEEYERFHEVMPQDSDQTVVAGLFDNILPMIPGIVDQLRSGITVADVGCSVGHALQVLAEKFPNSRFVGIDISEAAIKEASRVAADKGLANLTFRKQDAVAWVEPEKYDLIFTFDAIHDQAEPGIVLSNIHKSLKADGTYLMQDIAASSHLENNLEHPLGPLMYTISTMHCMSVSLANDGDGLGTCWGEELMEQMLREAGFTRLRSQKLPHDIQNVYFVCGK